MAGSSTLRQHPPGLPCLCAGARAVGSPPLAVARLGTGPAGHVRARVSPGGPAWVGPTRTSR
eukprot:6354606-Alexandrium_andersonii.AAC.1